ncbi:hypothetical protein B4U80_04869 [Leptotrombidium deliense]|uniref:G/T mismatch-specific thymine DNA glycosylase n=1 Tax=Leptotrombidium deliense TaxID=299467 RepID=A0A443SPF2_9ACAR|nr:hypothetical protein B4U80_04869 [Leptotrombidium deliense]
MTSNENKRKRITRFQGIGEQQLLSLTLRDYLQPNLDIVIIGINPGLTAAYHGHHYAGPGNHFWKCLYLSGLIPEPFTAFDDYKLLQYGIGFTNVVSRTTRGSSDLKTAEIREGCEIVRQKLLYHRPKIAVFNGKGIYEVYARCKCQVLGKQPQPIDGTDTLIYVMPSSSARCAQLPRLTDKLPFFMALKKLRDFVNGFSPSINLEEITFQSICKAKSEEATVKCEVKVEPPDDGC